MNFSRTVPVEITHPKAERPMRGFAIIDDQSTMAMLDPSAVALMGIPNQVLGSDTLSTTTVQGTSIPERCLTVNGLQVAPISQAGARIALPSTYLHSSLDSFSHEVPPKGQVAKMPGLQHLAQKSSKILQTSKR